MGTVQVQDTFTDTDGVLLNFSPTGHQPDVGQKWLPYFMSTNVEMAIDTNECKTTATDANPGFWFGTLVPDNSFSLEHDVELDFRIDAGNADHLIGAVGRIETASDFVYGYYQNSGGTGAYALVRVNAGIQTVMATGSEDLATGEHTLKLTCRSSGTNYDLIVDSVSKITATNSANVPAQSFVGMVIYAPGTASQAWRFDDFVGTEQATGGIMEADYHWGDK